MAILSTALLLVVLGVTALAVGLVARGRGENYGRTLVRLGAALILIGLLLVAYFILNFG